LFELARQRQMGKITLIEVGHFDINLAPLEAFAQIFGFSRVGARSKSVQVDVRWIIGHHGIMVLGMGHGASSHHRMGH
jgi:hypothetical protein